MFSRSLTTLPTTALKATANLYTAYEQTLVLLREHPEAGSRYLPKHPALSNLRMMPVQGFHDYLVFTRYDGVTLEVVRVLHSARNIHAVLEEESE